MTNGQTANAGFNAACHLMALLEAQARSTRQPDLMRKGKPNTDSDGQLDVMTMKF